MLPPRAYTFLGLNAARVFSIIVLLLVFASNVVIMANDIKAFKRGPISRMIVDDATLDDEEFDCEYFEGSTVPNQAAGIFFAILNRLFILFVSTLLILSEVGWPEQFFRNFIPVLGPDFGVGILGAIQCVMAASILSHFVSMFPRVSAFFMFSVGCLNILLGLIFRSTIKDRRSILSWKDSKAKSLLPGGPHFKVLETTKGSIFTGRDDDEKAGGHYPFGGYTNSLPTYSDVKTHITGSSADVKSHHTGASGSFGFGRQGSKAAGMGGFVLTRPLSTRARFAPEVPEPQSHSRSGSSQGGHYDKAHQHHVVGDYYDESPSSSRSGSPEPARQRPSSPPPGTKVTFNSSPSRI